MTTKERQARRHQILERAKVVFAEKGYHPAGVSDIIEKAGIARGTFYLYFTSKRDIFGKLLGELFHELDEAIRPVVLGPGTPPPLDQVRDNLRRVLEIVVRDPETMQILLHQATALDQQSRAVLRRFFEHVRGMIERSLKHGIRLGIVRPCDTRTVSSCVLGSVKQVAEQLAIGGRARKDLAPIADEILQYGLKGILKA